MGATVCVWEVYNDLEGSRTKSESQLRGARLHLASRTEGTHWNDSENPGHKTQSKYKDLCDWTQEIRSHQFSISHPHCFIPSSLMVLALQFSSLRLLHLLRESKLPALGFYILHVSGDPGYTEPSAFLIFSMGGATNCLLGAAMVRHFCSGTKSSFHLEALSRCFSWENRDQKLISFQIDWFDLLVV